MVVLLFSYEQAPTQKDQFPQSHAVGGIFELYFNLILLLQDYCLF